MREPGRQGGSVELARAPAGLPLYRFEVLAQRRAAVRLAQSEGMAGEVEQLFARTQFPRSATNTST